MYLGEENQQNKNLVFAMICAFLCHTPTGAGCRSGLRHVATPISRHRCPVEVTLAGSSWLLHTAGSLQKTQHMNIVLVSKDCSFFPPFFFEPGARGAAGTGQGGTTGDAIYSERDRTSVHTQLQPQAWDEAAETSKKGRSPTLGKEQPPRDPH